MQDVLIWIDLEVERLDMVIEGKGIDTDRRARCLITPFIYCPISPDHILRRH